jgi:hypothetical protein
MKILRSLVVLICLAVVLALIALWWNRPVKVDMSDYVPADSLVYIEINSFTDVAKAIQETEAWQTTATALGNRSKPQGSLAFLAARSGIGPVEAVVSTRAQMALVVVGVNTAEKENSLRIKPEVALVVETHTAGWRMKSTVVKNLKRLAEFAYGSSTCTERTAGADFVECVESRGSRKLIGAIDGTVVIIANSDKAVQNCLEVRGGQRPSLHTDPELLIAKKSLGSDSALSFGYVSQANSAKLFSLGAPLLLGKTPGDQQLEQLLGNSAAKILRGIAWASTATGGRIEDRYQISLEPEVTKRLEPAFETTKSNDDFWKLVPDAFRSLTVYKSSDPQTAWFSLNSAAATKLDAMSSMLFASLLKAGLSGYGIENPREVLGSLAPPVVTIRPVLGDGSLLLARVKDQEQLRLSLTSDLLREGKGQILTGHQSEPDKNREFAAVFLDGFVILGKTENVAVYLAQLRNGEMITTDHSNVLRSLEQKHSAAITTYTSERESLTSVVSALSLLNGHPLSDAELVEVRKRLNKFNVSFTESRLNSNGIERVSQSAFGQFGNLLALAQADSSTPLP